MGGGGRVRCALVGAQGIGGDVAFAGGGLRKEAGGGEGGGRGEREGYPPAGHFARMASSTAAWPAGSGLW